MASILQDAASQGQDGLVRQLLAEGADVNAADSDGRTPLYQAAQIGHQKVVQLLLAAGAHVDTADCDGITPLCAAATQGRHDAVQLLLAAGADVNAATTYGWISLHAAALFGYYTVVQLLLRKGANPQLQNSWNCTALYTAAQSAHLVDRDIVQLLLEAWGQLQITAADLVKAAKAAAPCAHTPIFALLAKELHRLYPAELQQLFEGDHPVSGPHAVAAILRNRASDFSTLDEQRAALYKREEDVGSAWTDVQHMLVADMASRHSTT